MKLIRDIFRRNPVEGDVGIEIEVEGDNLPPLRSPWRCEHDGSLRGEAVEYVFAKPLGLPEAYKALVKLDTAFTQNNAVIADTGRAGVHVHVNCQDLNIIELYNFMTLYLIFEDCLVEWCGPDRVGNLFCLRTQDAEFLSFSLIQALQDENFRRRFGSDELRYASMNVRALVNYGSLEFRAMRSTRDMDSIYLWASSLVDLRNLACLAANPTELIYQVSAGGEQAFLHNYLPGLVDEIEAMDDWKGMIRDGMRRAQEIAFAGDWEALAAGPKRVVGGLEVPFNWEDDFPPVDI